MGLFFKVNQITYSATYDQVSFSVIDKTMWGCPRGVMVKAMDFGIVVIEFELQLLYYLHILANTLGKGMDTIILPAMG